MRSGNAGLGSSSESAMTLTKSPEMRNLRSSILGKSLEFISWSYNRTRICEQFYTEVKHIKKKKKKIKTRHNANDSPLVYVYEILVHPVGEILEGIVVGYLLDGHAFLVDIDRAYCGH